MSTDTALIEKREELKRRLEAGEYKTLVDIFLEWFDRLIRKITRQSKPLPSWLITTILSMVFILIGFAAVYVSGDLTATRTYIELSTLGYGFVAFFLWALSIGVLAIATTVILNHYVHRLFKIWQADVLDATESVTSLEEIENWLKTTCNHRLHLYVTIIGGLLIALYLTVISSSWAGGFIGYGWTFGSILPSMFTAALLYLFLVLIFLSAKLRRYDLKLFAADPSSSELVSRLSSKLSLLIYFVGIYAAVLTFTTAFIGFLPSFAILLVLFYWLPIIAMFLLNQTSLSSVIRRAKWKTLNEIQAKVEKLQAVENFEDKETMEAINRLMDYHDRVKATRNSALDFGTYLNFINSLLLPLLAFILGNLDLVSKLFSRTP